jgi:gluconokinase
MNKPNIVVMGVAGCGKSSVGRLLAEALSASFLEGDTFHSVENIARMAAGTPLTDSDRAGWLALLAARLTDGQEQGERMVLACSALKRRYRDRLRLGDPTLLFVHLVGDKTLIADRMTQRPGHFMPTALIDSQFADLEALDVDEHAIVCSVTEPPQAIVARVLAHLNEESAAKTA